MSASEKSGGLAVGSFTIAMMMSSIMAAAFSIGLAYAQPITVVMPNAPVNATLGIETTNELLADYRNIPEFQRRSSPVGLFETRWTGPVGAAIFHFPCTAWLIDRNRILTNYHCYQPSTSNQNNNTINLTGYRLERATFRLGFLAEGEGRTYDARFVEGSRELDYAIFELNDNAGDIYGIVRIAAGFHSSADRLPTLIVHHPLGTPLMIAKDGTCHAQPYSLNNRTIRHMCDTRYGSSGSPLLVYNWARNPTGNADQVPYREAPLAIGLHFIGFQNRAPTPNHPNQAINMNLIVEDNDYLQSIACRFEGGGFTCPHLAHGEIARRDHSRLSAVELSGRVYRIYSPDIQGVPSNVYANMTFYDGGIIETTMASLVPTISVRGGHRDWYWIDNGHIITYRISNMNQTNGQWEPPFLWVAPPAQI